MTGLKRTLGLTMLSFYGVGMILGAGIYSIIGKAAGVTGETLWLGFILAAVCTLLTALSYAELSTMFPKAGAEFSYLQEAFKKQKWIGSTIGVAVAFSGAATAATVAFAFAGYVQQFYDVPEVPVAAFVLISFSGIALLGIKESGWVTVVSTLIELSGLALIIYFGITSERFGKALSIAPHFGTFSGAALIIFSFFGFENIVNLAEETKKPERNLPRAIFISIGVATTMYVLVSLSALALLTPEQLSKSYAPLMSVAQVHSVKAANILGAVALFSTSNTALISLIGASRIFYGMGKEGALPKITARVLTKRKTPWIASLVVLTLALALLSVGPLETVAGISSLATMTAFLLVNIALISLRFTEAKKVRRFKVPLHIGRLPLPPLIGTLLLLALLTQFETKVYLIGGIFLGVSAVTLFFRRKK
jgi:basic amino acid/polyamine antiporter, APA family